MGIRLSCTLMLVVACAAGEAGCAAHSERSATAGKATVLWISIDGMRGDYLERDKPPFLTRLMHEGAYSEHLRPAFPSLTFPSHVAEATGVPVSGNGIAGNSFFDERTRKLWDYPPDGEPLRAEPIWTTATREGVRTAVYDWPLSQMQTGPYAAAYFNHGPYDKKLSDEERLDRLATAYEQDHAAHPLRLLMGYAEATDPVGHKYGPDSPEVSDTLLKTDALLQKLYMRVDAVFERDKHPGDALYVLISTDHGMDRSTTGINLDLALGSPPAQDITIVTSGPVGNIYFRRDMAERDKRIDDLVGQLKSKSYAASYHVYRRNEVPAAWHYTDPDRVGDIVVVCVPDVTFQSKLTSESGPLSATDGPKGMHGYPVEWDAKMEGGLVMWRSDHTAGGRDLGPVQTVQLEPTVAAWLGIRPAPGVAAPISAP